MKSIHCVIRFIKSKKNIWFHGIFVKILKTSCTLQCGNYGGNLLAQSFDKNYVKTTLLLKAKKLISVRGVNFSFFFTLWDDAVICTVHCLHVCEMRFSREIEGIFQISCESPTLTKQTNHIPFSQICNLGTELFFYLCCSKRCSCWYEFCWL